MTLPPIPADRRLPEKDFLADFESARPRILGALLDALVCALRRLPEVTLPVLPRMADFALFATAAEPALAWPDGAFMEAYRANRAAAVEAIIEASLLAPAIRNLAEAEKRFDGTATELLLLLEEKYKPDEVSFGEQWPADAARLGEALRQISPALREVGIEVTRARTAEKRRITIRQGMVKCRHYRHFRHFLLVSTT